MCSCNYTYAGPALLVLPLCIISLINLFVAGPPLKTVVFDADAGKYSASLPYLQLRVAGPKATFRLQPKEEVTHFFVLTVYPSSAGPPLKVDAQVYSRPSALPLVSESVVPAVGAPAEARALQLLQPLLGHKEYEVILSASLPDAGAGAPKPADLPAAEYRITYVPARFTYTQICVRSFFAISTLCVLLSYGYAVCASGRKAAKGQLWVLALLVLLLGLNDPLYIARVVVGGNQAMYTASVLCQILFSGGIFMFWLVYAAGMHASDQRRGCWCARSASRALTHRSPTPPPPPPPSAASTCPSLCW